MKRVLLFILYIGLSPFLFSQVYHPIPTDSVYWVELESGYDGGNCTYYTYRYIYPVGNLIIEGDIYTEFRANSVTSFSNDYPPWLACPATQYSNNSMYIIIRNDSINKKIYFYDTNYTHQVKVLYDFNMSLGDTVSPESAICACSEQCPYDTFMVTNIDSIDIGGEYRRRFEITKVPVGDTIFMIEGIGANLGFAYNMYCPREIQTDLICYHYKNLSYSPPNFLESPFCTTTIGIQENVPFLNEFLKQSGPGVFQIVNTNNALMKVTCFNIHGQLMLQKDITESTVFDCSQLNTGIYYISLSINGHIFPTYKFLLSH